MEKATAVYEKTKASYASLVRFLPLLSKEQVGEPSKRPVWLENFELPTVKSEYKMPCSVFQGRNACWLSAYAGRRKHVCK